ncbi:MAG: FapA family protein [Desulfobacteraceae bacterium]|nr:FapA family protein [Desulfobacteraceae bacterium]
MDKYPLIGKFALQNKFITKGELDKALSACSGDENSLDEELTNYLVYNKLVSSKNIEKFVASAKILEVRKSELNFGKIAIKKGLISKNNLEFMLEEQENDILNNKEPRLLGDMLIEAGIITDNQRELVVEVQKNDENGHLLLEPVFVSKGLKLQMAADFLSAFLIKTEKFSKSCTLNDIKDILLDKGIIFGVVTDEMIVSFLKSQIFEKKTFRVARGIKPVQGEDAKIDYFFNTKYLKAGGVATDGQIDFKDRGKIPQVEKEMVLAKKIPMVEALAGKNLYGEAVIVKPATDVKIKIGKGAKLSANGLQVLAAVNGHPKISSSREICVDEEYIIKGNVDYETGHIDYDGDISIKGCIKSGFKVKGHNIKALEIDDGTIDAQGDVNISDGIIKGEIYVQGNLSAKYIHNSHITCMGDVASEKEIIDATIENRGKCSVVNGKIISSKIISKMGVFAKDIGTEKGKPSAIRVGHDIFVEKDLAKNQIGIDAFNKVLDSMVVKQTKKEEKNKKIQKEVSEYSDALDNSQMLQQKIIAKMDSLKDDSGKIEYPEAIKEKLTLLQEEIKQEQEKLDLAFKINQGLEREIKELDQKIGQQKLKIKNLEFERESLIKWLSKNSGKAVMIVNGVIMAKTVIYGKHSKKVLEEESKNVTVKEVRDTKPGAGPGAYKIETTS